MKLEPKIEIIKTVSVRKTITLSQDDVAQIIRDRFKAPKTAEVQFHTGYDDLEQVVVTWNATEEIVS